MILCVYCKEAHASQDCPLYLKAQKLFTQKTWKLSSSFSTQAPAPFVGEFGYPKVSVGMLSPPNVVDNVDEYDAPRQWAVGNYQIPQIVNFRSSLINSREAFNIFERKNRRLGVIQEVGMAKKAVDVDVNLKKAPRLGVVGNKYHLPHGPRGLLKSVVSTSNARVNIHVEKAVSDTDFKAKDALLHLYKKNIDGHKLMQLLSVGTLGVGKRRKLVPTKWSITATDDTLSKHLYEEIQQYPVGEVQSYFGGYLGNYFFILFFDRPWSYELFEMSLRNRIPYVQKPLSWTTDFETSFGRKGYATETAGGYYATRLPLLEKMKSLKKQGSVLVLRFITSEYTLPLGVWVVREAVRKALSSKPVYYSDYKQGLDHARQYCLERFKVDVNQVYQESKLIKGFNQRSLSSFF